MSHLALLAAEGTSQGMLAQGAIYCVKFNPRRGAASE